MKKEYVILSVILVAAAGVAYFYYSPSIKSERRELTADQRADIKVFFDFAQEQLPIAEQKLSDERKKRTGEQKEIDALQDKINLCKTVIAIAHNDLKTLEAMTAQELQFKNGDLWVPASKFKNNMEGRLMSHIIGGENALFFVIYHAILNTSYADDKNTLTMLKLLLEKGLSPDGRCGEVFFVKDKPTDTSAPDYVAEFTLDELAQGVLPAARDLLRQYSKNKSK